MPNEDEEPEDRRPLPPPDDYDEDRADEHGPSEPSAYVEERYSVEHDSLWLKTHRENGEENG